MADPLPGTNPKDTLTKNSEAQQRELLLLFSRHCHNFSYLDVKGAGLNLLINVYRQAYRTRAAAEAAFNTDFGRTKEKLFEHYDSVSGLRRPNFAFHQTVQMSPFTDKDGFKK